MAPALQPRKTIAEVAVRLPILRHTANEDSFLPSLNGIIHQESTFFGEDTVEELPSPKVDFIQANQDVVLDRGEPKKEIKIE